MFVTKKITTQPNNKIVAFLKKPKNLIFAIVAIIIAIVLVCIITNAIRNAVITKQVQSYFDGKTFILENENTTSVYTFKQNTMGQESWWTSDKSSYGNINEMVPYKIKRDSGSKNFRLWHVEKETGRWVYGSIILFGENRSFVLTDYLGDNYIETTMDHVNNIRTKKLCNHEFGEETVIKEATCSSGGEITHTCTNCGFTEKQSTSTLEHNYINKICTECGAEKQPERAYNVKPNTWYVRNDILFYQNCKISSASSGTSHIMVSYYAVCQNCHTISEMPYLAGPEINYPVSKIYICEYCQSSTIVNFRIGDPY
ncbi:MAG: hypothetical protein IJP35_07890 [Clostridia bacterium]|nr:hypothetical protein [Clostridia bacterium]